MQISKDPNTAAYQIHSFDSRGVQVNDTLWTESLVLLPGLPPAPWPVTAIATLTLDACAALAAAQPELVILGSGADVVFPETAVQMHLLTQGIGLEVMTTAAACRTYNLLAQDGRQVAAGLILPG